MHTLFTPTSTASLTIGNHEINEYSIIHQKCYLVGNHCVKSVPIRSYSGPYMEDLSVFSPNA